MDHCEDQAVQWVIGTSSTLCPEWSGCRSVDYDLVPQVDESARVEVGSLRSLGSGEFGESGSFECVSEALLEVHWRGGVRVRGELGWRIGRL